MLVHEIIAALMDENPYTEVAIHTEAHGWVILEGFESANDPKTDVVVPSFSEAIETNFLDVRLDSHMSPDAITPDDGWKSEDGITWVNPDDATKALYNVAERRAENRRRNLDILREKTDA
jgi:hypothetical protein